MIPVEYFWFALIFAFCIVGMIRGLAKELGASTILLITLFALGEGWELVVSRFAPAALGKGAVSPSSMLEVAYYGIAILLVAFISYEGVVLNFPMRGTQGLPKAFLGLLGGLLNGYLVVGTVWNVVARAGYLQARFPGIMSDLTDFHNMIVHYLPVSVIGISPFIFLVPGLFLLLLIVLK